jgi:Spy/CpxP family protein refolding chaperone
MKRYILAALAATLLAPGLSAFAQDDAPPPPPAPQADHSDQPRRDGGMGDRAKRLGLTDEQSAKFEDAMKAHREAMKQQGQAVKDSVKKLAEGIKAKASDDDLRASLAALKSARKAMFDENEKFEESLAAFLTPTQQAKMAVGAAMMMRNRLEGGRGGRGGDDDGGHRGPRDGGEGE